jgi:putative FmdB family regulatory protein
MPIYEYRCTNGHNFEVFRAMTDDPVAECEECGAPVERVFHPVAVHYKGSGFYATDYAKKAAADDGGGADSSAGSEKKSDSEKKTESKSESSKSPD